MSDHLSIDIKIEVNIKELNESISNENHYIIPWLKYTEEEIKDKYTLPLDNMVGKVFKDNDIINANEEVQENLTLKLVYCMKHTSHSLVKKQT